MTAELQVLHLSDTHLLGDGSLHVGVTDTVAALNRVLRRADALRHIDAVVMSGDLTDDGSAESYRLLRSTVEPWAQDRGAQVVYVMGNHDGRDGFEAVIGPRTGVSTVRGARFIRLDSSVPGYGYGSIDAAQLAWLRSELATPAEQGSVVVMHHPPVGATTPLLQALELENRDELLDVLAGTDVRLVLAGHFHHSLTTTVRGIPLIVAPGITNTTDVLATPGHERAVVGSGAVVVTLPLTDGTTHDPRTSSYPIGDVPPPTARFFTAPSAHDGDEVYDFNPAAVEARAAKAGKPGKPGAPQ